MKVGLNAGEPVAEDDDLFGTVVQLAQRACDAAVGGQILATATVHDLAQGKGFVFGAIEHRQLKGFDEPVLLWPVEHRQGREDSDARTPVRERCGGVRSRCRLARAVAALSAAPRRRRRTPARAALSSQGWGSLG